MFLGLRILQHSNLFGRTTFLRAGTLWSWLQDSEPKSLATKSPNNADSGTTLFPNIRRKSLRHVLPIYNTNAWIISLYFFLWNHWKKNKILNWSHLKFKSISKDKQYNIRTLVKKICGLFICDPVNKIPEDLRWYYCTLSRVRP